MTKLLLKGNIAVAEAAIIAGCRYYFGYPITPQNEIPMYLSKRMPEVGGVFVQAESELASINMVFGAAAAGARVMTTTSSPGYSLMQEGVSYIASAELPCVLLNVMRGGPGLGNIAPAQGDYFQAVKGGGHGDYKLIVLAGENTQEMAELVIEAFDLADLYKTPVLLLGDGLLGQLSEPVELPKPSNRKMPEKKWALTGAKGRKKNVIRTLWLYPEEAVTNHNIKLFEKYSKIEKELLKYELYKTEDAELIIAAYGTSARISKESIDMARSKGMKVGMIRPITLWPFPGTIMNELADKCKKFLTVEMSMGQFVEDVKLSICGKAKTEFFGLGGGWVPTAEDIFQKIKEYY
ncbi:MAG: 3-methyl-2-oxobutanoate dehydrogenase subunit VorB [Spirochaetes bacterium]|nr:3-methyl-2-oxobutanoate dehydrogenase subunit VorB [Spirochaetota bacterium]